MVVYQVKRGAGAMDRNGERIAVCYRQWQALLELRLEYGTSLHPFFNSALTFYQQVTY